jgi:hypothetical protein
LPESLAQVGIAYVHIPELGGLRGRRAEIDASPNIVWQNESFRNYADYAMTEPFMAGFLKLLGGAVTAALSPTISLAAANASCTSSGAAESIGQNSPLLRA